MPDKSNFQAVVKIENVSNETTAPCLTKQLSEQSGQDLGATGALVVANAEDKVYGADLSQKAEGIGFMEEIASCVNGLKHPGHGNHVIIEKMDKPIVIDRAAYNQGANALYDPKVEETETTPPSS